jgi:mono/diheme cytochrome c family protein
MANILGLATMLAAATSLAWSGLRARRMKNKFVKWGVMGLAAVLAVAASLAAALMIVGTIKQHARSAPVPDLEVEASAERIARGKAVVDGFCSGCHSRTGTLTGGLDIGEHFPLRVGSFVSSNLTPAGRLKRWSDGEIFRAIRNGIDADGRWLTLMSYTNAGNLSDDDTQAVIAYIRSVPAAGEPTPDPPSRLNLLGLLMLSAGMLPSGKPVITSSITAPPKGPTFAFGEYILSYQDCRECHGRDLACRGNLGRSHPTSISSSNGSLRNSSTPCARASIPTAMK